MVVFSVSGLNELIGPAMFCWETLRQWKCARHDYRAPGSGTPLCPEAGPLCLGSLCSSQPWRRKRVPSAEAVTA